MERCRWCKTDVENGAARCPRCNTWQSSAYGPAVSAIASAIGAVLTPIVIVWVTLNYQQVSHTQDLATQQSNRAQDAARTRLDQTFKEVKAIVDMEGDWQLNYEALLIDCEPEHREDNDKCLADYTRRLVKLDAYIAQLSWAVSASPVGEVPRSRIRELGEAWWTARTGARDAITSTFGRLAIRTGKAATITNAGTSYDDYNRIVAFCEKNWADPTCPNLRQCQQRGFEHSECVKEIGDAIKGSGLDDIVHAAFCAVVVSLDATRIEVMRELNASGAALAAYETQLCSSTCYVSAKEEFTEARIVCEGRRPNSVVDGGALSDAAAITSDR
jgi:hypothetical protein